MDPSHPTDINSQENEGDLINITQFSNPARDENVDHPSVDEVNQTYVSPPQVTENSKEIQCGIGTGIDITQEMSSEDDGSEIENNVNTNGEEKHLEKNDNVSSRKTRNLEEVVKEIKLQKTHDLYCPNCTLNITGTTKLFVKGQEISPYNNERFVFVIIFSFKYPFIYLPWLYNITQVEPIQPETPPRGQEPVEPSQQPEPPLPNEPKPMHPKPPLPNEPNPIHPKPPLPEDPPAPKPDNRTIFPTLLEKIRETLLPNSLPRLTPTSQRFLLASVLLLLSIILLWTLPSRPSPPPPPRPSPDNPANPRKTDDSFSRLKNFLSNNYLSIILLLFLATLAVLWRSMLGDSDELNNNESQKVSSINLLPIKLDCLDILKSIVYGGLIESITSFGVVSSAAASGTSTLNVLALGLANLFSGLFIIIHNLYGLFKRPRYQSWNNDHMPELVSPDPYEELLGKRNRVILHCFVVLVSFIFFGVIPPLFYGFSIKLTDKGHYQEAAIFVAASLICVISLSFAKAYAFGMDKLKTVAAYTGIAIAGSALSFVASQHARDVFAKYDFQKLASDYLKG